MNSAKVCSHHWISIWMTANLHTFELWWKIIREMCPLWGWRCDDDDGDGDDDGTVECCWWFQMEFQCVLCTGKQPLPEPLCVQATNHCLNQWGHHYQKIDFWDKFIIFMLNGSDRSYVCINLFLLICYHFKTGVFHNEEISVTNVDVENSQE